MRARRGNLGEMLFHVWTLRRGSNATIHEITHVLAPNANRFLAEGLATYAEEHLKGNAAYPNFGNDLNKAACALAGGSDLGALADIATPARLQNGQFDS